MARLDIAGLKGAGDFLIVAAIGAPFYLLGRPDVGQKLQGLWIMLDKKKKGK